MNYPLEERTYTFGKKVVLFCKQIPDNQINLPLINQLIRSGTSIGANYCEANGAASKKDFKNKIHICKKEAQETRYWLRIIGDVNVNNIHDARELEQEAKELSMIFGKIVSTMNKSKLKLDN